MATRVSFAEADFVLELIPHDGGPPWAVTDGLTIYRRNHFRLFSGTSSTVLFAGR